MPSMIRRILLRLLLVLFISGVFACMILIDRYEDAESARGPVIVR